MVHPAWRRVGLAAVLALGLGTSLHADVAGWLQWRGPQQNGVSQEQALPGSLSLEAPSLLWSRDISGRGTPVIAGDRVYSWGFVGEGQELQEVLTCLDAATGKTIWEHRFNDFLSDIIYDRYSIGSPVVDSESGNVYLLTSPGLALAFSPEGNLLWKHSLTEELGRLTFPNGRTGAPIIEGKLAIYRGVTSNWGADGPARDRFYAFDKITGELVWSSTPGLGSPFLKDSSFSTGIVADWNGRRVLYVGLGCGNVAAIDLRTGEPLWRVQFSIGGVNGSPVLFNNTLIVSHAAESIDSSKVGGMGAVRIPAKLDKPGAEFKLKDVEAWHNDLAAFSSSAVLVDGVAYQATDNGDLSAVDAATGQILWHKKLGSSTLHASPLYAAGKLYVPMLENGLHVLKVSREGGEVLQHLPLEGKCMGSPSAWAGKLYVHTSSKLYCFGTKDAKAADTKPATTTAATPAPAGPAVALRVTPSEVLLRPGQAVPLKVTGLDALGHEVPVQAKLEWKPFIPATAKVKATLDATVEDGVLKANPKARYSAGAFEVTAGELRGVMRGRILPELPIKEDFEASQIVVDHETEKGVKFAYPPLPWMGARFKWEVRELEGNKVLAKTLDNILFMRSMAFFGHPDMHNYTVQADVMSDGNRRVMSTVGVINQRYIVVLKGNHQELEVNSNHERLKVAVPFKWKAGVWYTIKSRVDLAADGSGVIRAKAWPRGEAEPENWQIEVPHKHAHQEGSPGIFGFSPQSQFRVYVDNIAVTPNS